MNMILSSLYVFTISVLFIVIPVIIGIYVYRDANRRGMNATLWTLIAVLAPTFIGLIVYLVVRADQTALQCPNCQKPVTEKFTVCPHCGTSLKNKCSKCDNPLEATWANCPNCREAVPEGLTVPVVAVQKDKGLGKILLAVILIPLMVMVLLIFGLLNFRSTGSESVSSSGGMRAEDFAGNILVSEWLKTCDAQGDGTYVLAYEQENERGENGMQSYIIYRKGLSSFVDAAVHVAPKTLFKESALRVEYFNTDLVSASAPNYNILLVDYFGSDRRLELLENGIIINYVLETTNTPISFNDLARFNNHAAYLFAARLDYLGDNSGVSNLIDETGLSGIGPYSIELETEKEPYGLRIVFESVPKDFEMIDFSSTAIELLGLIKNLDHVEITDGEHSYTLTAKEASQTLGFDVKELGQSKEKLEDYLQSLQGSYD